MPPSRAWIANTVIFILSTKRWVRRVIRHRRKSRICGALPNFPDPETRKLKNDELTLTLPAHGLALIELK